MMQKVVLKVELHDDRIKTKAMKTVSGLSGVESVSVDMKDQKLILIGDIDPVRVVAKLRKLCHADILSVGPAKEEKKKEEPKKEKKKEEPKKEKKKEKPKKKKDPKEELAGYVELPYCHYYVKHPEEELAGVAKASKTGYDQTRLVQPYAGYDYDTVEEDPYVCVIC